jgi:hypothetical protein
MIDALMKAKPVEVQGILKDAGCTVTIDEHRNFDDKCDEWDRVREAKVAVSNTETGEHEIFADSE